MNIRANDKSLLHCGLFNCLWIQAAERQAVILDKKYNIHINNMHYSDLYIEN